MTLELSIFAKASIIIYSFIVLATVIMIINYNHTVITIVNYDPKPFIVQATDRQKPSLLTGGGQRDGSDTGHAEAKLRGRLHDHRCRSTQAPAFGRFARH
jgi:hypothetical protein